jgi:hypothetical protein
VLKVQRLHCFVMELEPECMQERLDMQVRLVALELELA